MKEWRGKLDFGGVAVEAIRGKRCMTLASGSWGLPAVSLAPFEIPALQQAGTLWCMETGNQINKQTNSLASGQTTTACCVTRSCSDLRLTGLNCKHAHKDRLRRNNLHEGRNGRDRFTRLGSLLHFKAFLVPQHLHVCFFFCYSDRFIHSNSSFLAGCPNILEFSDKNPSGPRLNKQARLCQIERSAAGRSSDWTVELHQIWINIWLLLSSNGCTKTFKCIIWLWDNKDCETTTFPA